MYSINTDEDGLLAIEDVQKILNRSRASVYRYTNTDPDEINPPFQRRLLNPEIRKHKDEPLMFHPNEVNRFAQEVLGHKPITINVQQPLETVTQELLRAILEELRAIREHLEGS